MTFADFWIQDQEFRDPDTGESFDRDALNAELEKIEKPAGISNPKDFRNEIVNFVLRARASNGGKNPAWTSYEKLRDGDREEDVLEHRGSAAGHLVQRQGLRRRRRRSTRTSSTRMVAKGYTDKQVRLLCEWYLRVRKTHTCVTGHVARDVASCCTMIIDRRLNARKNKRRSTASASCAATRADQATRSKRMVGERSITRHGQRRRHHAAQARTWPSRCSAMARAATANSCIPATSEYVRGDQIPRPKAAAAAAAAAARPATATSEDDFVFSLSREEFMNSSSTISSCRT